MSCVLSITSSLRFCVNRWVLIRYHTHLLIPYYLYRSIDVFCGPRYRTTTTWATVSCTFELHSKLYMLPPTILKSPQYQGPQQLVHSSPSPAADF